MKKLKNEYAKRKREIKKRLRNFARIYKGKEKDIFAELCFCLLTPQSKAVNCDKAIRELKKSGLLLKGSPGDIKPCLRRLVRFHNKKSKYLVAARKVFSKRKIDPKNILKTREWLVKNIKGLSYKEAGHFLRNIGLGRGVAILDVHILRNLKRLGVIKKVPSAMSRRAYLETEDKMKKFAEYVNIPLEELDLLLWSGETGFVFK